MSASKLCLDLDTRFIANVSGSISPVVEKCLTYIIKDEGLTTCDVKVRDISTNGGNYMGSLQEIQLKGKSENGDKEINLFLKNKLSVEELNEMVEDAYNREAFCYNELMNIYNGLQDDANIPPEERFRTVKSYKESNTEVTILENVTKRGYSTPSRLEAVSLDFAAKSFQQLAKFHALSFALQKKNPDFFEKNIKPIRAIYVVNEKWENFVKQLFDEAIVHLDAESRQKIVEHYPIMIEKFKQFVKIPDDEAICLCHGDFRPNNIMKLEQNGEIKNLIPVDFQLIHCGSPVTDIHYFISSGTNHELRAEHMEELKEIYYDTLRKFLKYFSIDVEDVYSKERFVRDYYNYLEFGLNIFFTLSPFIFCDTDEIPELENGFELKFKWNERSKERLRGIVKDFLHWKQMKF